MKNPTRFYTSLVGIFLLLQGVSTLLFRLIPSLNEAFPQLLAITQMVPIHSTLHIVTGLIALWILFKGGEVGALWFTIGFAIFYTGLALYGFITHSATIFHLQPFDHPFHLLIGVLGMIALGIHFYNKRKIS
ncbi:MAG: DUF4383 domain-containing protein [Anaerolineales bacterium]|nr:DUF4383 domain-containing protein [Anaerolineales bacterium]